MKPLVFDKLFSSIRRLSDAIDTARKVANTLPSDRAAELLTRLDSYKQMLDKQEACSLALYRSASHGRWSEVSRHIKIINALSVMIRDDAKELLLRAKGTPVAEHEGRPLLQ